MPNKRKRTGGHGRVIRTRRKGQTLFSSRRRGSGPVRRTTRPEIARSKLRGRPKRKR